MSLVDARARRPARNIGQAAQQVVPGSHHELLCWHHAACPCPPQGAGASLLGVLHHGAGIAGHPALQRVLPQCIIVPAAAADRGRPGGGGGVSTGTPRPLPGSKAGTSGLQARGWWPMPGPQGPQGGAGISPGDADGALGHLGAVPVGVGGAHTHNHGAAALGGQHLACSRAPHSGTG